MNTVPRPSSERIASAWSTWLDLARPNGKAIITDPETGDVLDAKKVEGGQKGGKIVLRDGEPGGACALGEGIEKEEQDFAASQNMTNQEYARYKLEMMQEKARMN